MPETSSIQQVVTRDLITRGRSLHLFCPDQLSRTARTGISVTLISALLFGAGGLTLPATGAAPSHPARTTRDSSQSVQSNSQRRQNQFARRYLAQTPGPSEASGEKSEPTVADIVSKTLTAYGGKDALAQVITSSTLFGKQFQTGGGSQAYRHLRKGSRWRTDVECASPEVTSGNGQTETSAFGGEAA